MDPDKEDFYFGRNVQEHTPVENIILHVVKNPEDVLDIQINAIIPEWEMGNQQLKKQEVPPEEEEDKVILHGLEIPEVLDNSTNAITPDWEMDHQQLDKQKDPSEEENIKQGVENQEETLENTITVTIPDWEIDQQQLDKQEDTPEEESVDLHGLENPEKVLDNPTNSITPFWEQDHQQLDKQDDPSEEENIKLQGVEHPEEIIDNTIIEPVPDWEMDQQQLDKQEDTFEENINLQDVENPDEILDNTIIEPVPDWEMDQQQLDKQEDTPEDENINLQWVENPEEILDNTITVTVPDWEINPQKFDKQEDTPEENINLQVVENPEEILDNTIIEPVLEWEMDQQQLDKQEDTPEEENINLQGVENPEEILDNTIIEPVPDWEMDQQQLDKQEDTPGEENVNLQGVENPEEILDNTIIEPDPDRDMDQQQLIKQEDTPEEENVNLQGVENPEEILDNTIIEPVPDREMDQQQLDKQEDTPEENINLQGVENPEEILDNTIIERVPDWELDQQQLNKQEDTPEEENTNLQGVENPEEILDNTIIEPDPDREMDQQQLNKQEDTPEENMNLQVVENPEEILDNTITEPVPDWEMDQQQLDKQEDTPEENINLQGDENPEEILDNTIIEPDPDWEMDQQQLDKQEDTHEEDNINLQGVENPGKILDNTITEPVPDREMDQQQLDKQEDTPEENTNLQGVENPEEILDNTIIEPDPDREMDQQQLNKQEDTPEEENVNLQGVENPEEMLDNKITEPVPDWEMDQQQLDKQEDTPEENINLQGVENPEEILDNTIIEPDPDWEKDQQQLDKQEDTPEEENINLQGVENPEEILDNTITEPVPDWEMDQQQLDKQEDTPEENINQQAVENPEEILDNTIIEPVPDWEMDQQQLDKQEDTPEEENTNLQGVENPEEILDNTIIEPDPDREMDQQQLNKQEDTPEEENVNLQGVENPEEMLDNTITEPVPDWEMDQQQLDKQEDTPEENINLQGVENPEEILDNTIIEPDPDREMDQQQLNKQEDTPEENINLQGVENPEEMLDNTIIEPVPDWEMDQQQLDKQEDTPEENINLQGVENPEEILDNTIIEPDPDREMDQQQLDKQEDTPEEENINLQGVENPEEILDNTITKPVPDREMDQQQLDKQEDTPEENINLQAVENPEEILDNTIIERVPDWEMDQQQLDKQEDTPEEENTNLQGVENPEEILDNTIIEPDPDREMDQQQLNMQEDTPEEDINLQGVENPEEMLDNTITEPVPDWEMDQQQLDKQEDTPEENINLQGVENPEEILDNTIIEPDPDREMDQQQLNKQEDTPEEENTNLQGVENPEEILDHTIIEPVPDWEMDQQQLEKQENTPEENINLQGVENPEEILDNNIIEPVPDWEMDQQQLDKQEDTSEENINLYGVENQEELLDNPIAALIPVCEPDDQQFEKQEDTPEERNINLQGVENPAEALYCPVNATIPIWEPSSHQPDQQEDIAKETINLQGMEKPGAVILNPLNATLPEWESDYQQSGNHKDKMMPDISQIPEYAWDFKRKTFDEKLKELNMEEFQTSKLSLTEVLKIGQENLKKLVPQKIEHVPWCFLQNLMALNGRARNTRLEQSLDTKTSGLQDEDMDFMDNMDTSNSIHPLDVLCVLLHCSDSFLQQEIVTKMSMCQFSLPLLLPSSSSSECTFMLWAMRDIVKRWRPQSLVNIKGCREDNLVNIPMPIFSFVRLGKCNLSKSRILNYMLSTPQQHHDFFVHQNMEGANISREVSDGLVEIAWFFPGGRENMDLFPDPVAVTNLRGELESNLGQFSYLTKVSTAVFIFIEDIDERQYSLLSNTEETNTNYFIIIAPSSRCISGETQRRIKTLYPILKINRKNVLVKNSCVNDAELVKKLQMIIADLIKSSSWYITLEEMSHIAGDLGIQVDENSEGPQNTRKMALEISKSIKDVVQYKNATMRLQGDLWKQLAKSEKEICRMKGLGSHKTEDYKAKLVKKCSDLRKQQSEFSLPGGMVRFIDAITGLPKVEKHYFLKWLKLYVDSISRNHLCVLQAEYKEHCYNITTNLDKLKHLDQIISKSSLGIEHFIREVGQFYEAECFLAKDSTIEHRKLYKLPGIAADLLLDGFPLELIDGDASNIPLQWITDVLTELDTKTGGHCRMRVITVLGVQSTGKSTLLNTMFGLQFPVASGRCTRGAFMTLIKVKENFQEELGCDFILVIDTEGLKAPELAFLEDSYEHDNELATLVVGLSDITIINMAMENTTDIRDILQIVVHAFLRMKEIGKKPNCQFVHQNVSDVSAHDKNMRDRKKFLEQLDEMTKVAARMEENENVIKFSDVMEYDLEQHSWYIPGLWHGVPPMASVNTGYSENIFELKINLFEIMKKQLKSKRTQTISDFINWVKSLWNAVKYEKFLFSFRNSLVAEAYNQLSIKYSELEWNFRKRMHKWMMETENEILNQTDSELEAEKVKKNMQLALQEEERLMSEALEIYFESGNKYVHLVERYKEDFFRSVMTLRNEIEDNLGIQCEEAMRIQRGKHELQFVQNGYLKSIEEKSTSLLDNCRSLNHQLSDEELQSEFETMWNKTISLLQFSSLKKHNISQEMVEQLRKDMRNKAGYINEKLNEVRSLDEYGQNGLNLDEKYTQSVWCESMPEPTYTEYRKKVNDLVTSLKDKCNRQVAEQLNTMKDYHQMYCQELLNIINERLNRDDVRNLHLTPLFELDLKLHILGRVAPMYQKKHNSFFQENNAKLSLDKLKSQYFSTFKNVYHQKDESKIRAQKFCETCLKPALSEYVYKNLGGEIVNDILTSGDSIRYSSRTFFQYTLLKALLEDHIFAQYAKYNNHYEIFVKNWIIKYITEKYKESASLESLKSNILATISRKVRETLKDTKVRGSSNVSQCLKTFCTMLKKYLVIAQNEMKVIIYQNNANPGQFAVDIEEFLPDIEKQIITEIKNFTIEYVLSKATMKPQDELFKKVFGCGKQCPFCKAPCEAGAADHKEHFASVHRPQGLGTYRCSESKVLSHSICTTDVVGNTTFLNSDTEWKPRLYKEYRKIYPDWSIQPDPTISASDYWKFVFKEFNKQFSDYYNAKLADLPEDWYQITKEKALQSLKESFNMK